MDRPFAFPKSQHLRSGREFAAVYDAKQRVGDDVLLVYALPSASGGHRLGLSVSRRNGNAVARNRLKRRLREAFRLTQAELPGQYDLVLIPRPGRPGTVAEYRRSLAALVRRLHRRFDRAARSCGGS